jgi:hypothetical protein
MTAPEHNHSPLPWREDDSGLIVDAEGNVVNIYGHHPQHDKKQFANRRLIVAAANPHVALLAAAMATTEASRGVQEMTPPSSVELFFLGLGIGFFLGVLFMRIMERL